MRVQAAPTHMIVMITGQIGLSAAERPQKVGQWVTAVIDGLALS